MTIPWDQYVFAALEAVFSDETQRITLYGHDDAKCKKIVGKTAPKTSLVQYLEARGRKGEKFPEPWPCSCVDVIDVQLAAIEKAAEKVVSPEPTPAENLQSQVEDLAAKAVIRSSGVGNITWTVAPDPVTPTLSKQLEAQAKQYLRTLDPANEKFEFLADLARKLQRDPNFTMTPKQAIGVIKCRDTRGQPRPQRTDLKPVDLTQIPQGRYAAQNSNGGITFLRVDRPADGQWAGWVFIKQVIGGQPDIKFCSQKPGQSYRGSYGDLLQRIIDDLPAAEALYGTQLGQCARCNRTLTDATSRSLGIGPECRKK